MTDDICGAETTKDRPCQNDADSCPWHGEDATAEPRGTLLEEQPEIKEIIVGELQAGATVPEACAEAGVSKRQYYSWRDKAQGEDEGLFREFRDETTHARRIASKEDRRSLKDKCVENDDTRTWYKLHHDQYGDTYGKEEPEERETGDRLRLGVPDELTEQWQQQLKN
jgi:transposase-like protein